MNNKVDVNERSMIIDDAVLNSIISSSSNQEEAIYRSAIYYIGAGLPVCIVEKNGKAIIQDGYEIAITDKKKAAKLLGKNGVYAGCNIGIGCGSVVCAIDIDNGPGKNGITNWQELCDGREVTGPIQGTPSGGEHILLKQVSGFISSTSKLAKSVDTRGSSRGKSGSISSHIVAAPSVVNGKRYYWKKGGQVTHPPKWLVSMFNDGNQLKSTPREDLEIPDGQIERMIGAIDIDEVTYDEWVRVGMALKSILGDDGLQLWDEWSELGERRRGNECYTRWRTFDVDGDVGLGTLLFIARDYGWEPEAGDITSVDREYLIQEFNKKFALLRVNNILRIVIFNESDKRKFDLLNIEHFNTYTAKYTSLSKEGKSVPISKLWLASESRRQYEEMRMYPYDKDEHHNPIPTEILNSWRGWAVEPSEEGSCELYLRHMKEVICNDDEFCYNWLLDWMADCIQDPLNIKGTCVILKGVEGCGKGVWANTFGEILGDHYLHVSDSSRLSARFNSQFNDKVVVFADEVIASSDKHAANVLKGMITETKQVRERKGVESDVVRNVSRIIIASNESWVVDAGPQSRRFFVLEVPSYKKGDIEYFSAIIKEMKEGGSAKLLHILHARAILNNLRESPVTDGLIKQRNLSSRHDTVLMFLVEKVESGSFDSTDVDSSIDEGSRWPAKLNTPELLGEYRRWTQEAMSLKMDIFTLVMFKDKLTDIGIIVDDKFVYIPPVKEMKQILNKKRGI